MTSMAGDGGDASSSDSGRRTPDPDRREGTAPRRVVHPRLNGPHPAAAPMRAASEGPRTHRRGPALGQPPRPGKRARGWSCRYRPRRAPGWPTLAPCRRARRRCRARPALPAAPAGTASRVSFSHRASGSVRPRAAVPRGDLAGEIEPSACIRARDAAHGRMPHRLARLCRGARQGDGGQHADRGEARGEPPMDRQPRRYE